MIGSLFVCNGILRIRFAAHIRYIYYMYTVGAFAQDPSDYNALRLLLHTHTHSHNGQPNGTHTHTHKKRTQNYILLVGGGVRQRRRRRLRRQRLKTMLRHPLCTSD